MRTRICTIALLAAAMAVAVSEDASAGTRHRGRTSRPIFGSGCRYAAPTYAAPTRAAPPATGFAYRSYYSAPAETAPLYRTPATTSRSTPTYLLPKMDPRKHSGGR